MPSVNAERVVSDGDPDGLLAPAIRAANLREREER